MKNFCPRDRRHILANTLICAGLLLALAGCESGVSGHAPGVAGQESLDPGSFTYPLAYIKRPFPTKDISAANLITSTPGGDVYIRSQASAGSKETNITASITKGKGDVRDLDVSPDGTKLIFSLRLPLDPNKGNTDVTQPTWKIYQYDALTQTVTQLTNDNSTAGHDVGAHYLPDGRIVFSSTRQAATQALLIDESVNGEQFPVQSANDPQDDNPKQPIFQLHVMNADGSNIHQISFNTNHDFAPSVLADGRIVFSRYESVNGGQISLYRARPDGTQLELYYGENSHPTGASADGTNTNEIQFLNARQRNDGKLVAIARPFTGTQLGGDILQIDAENYVECDQPATPITPSGTCTNGRPAQSSATSVGVTTDPNQRSLGGRFASVYPLYDGTNRMLLSWSPCFVLNTHVTPNTTEVCTTANSSGADVQLAPPAYTVWIYDIGAGTLSPVLAAEAGLTIVDPVVLQARTPLPPKLADTPLTGEPYVLATNTNAPLGILEIRSVYDFDGVDEVANQTSPPVPGIAALADPKIATAAERPARFIRVEKAVEIPSDKVRKIDQNDFGQTDNGMRDILAYAPIEPDGSVKLQLPANVPFTIEILDADARRISAPHTAWLQLMPGETKTCTGCHTAGSVTRPSHGRAGLTTSVYAGATAPGALFPDTLNFPAIDTGDTMADARTVNTCQSGAAGGCSELPTIDVLYTDVWTDPAVRTPDPPISYAYGALNTPQPINANCIPWNPLCRSTIEYPLQLQQVWNFVRRPPVVTAALPAATCTVCHNGVSAAGAVQVPAGYLDLTDTASSVIDVTFNTSYVQLLFAHNEQALNMGVSTTLTVPAAMTPGSANGTESKARFFSLFDGTYKDPSVGKPGYVDHTNFLTPAELRLISEWLDIGAQYYNNPFVAPAN
jgi:hypothetical protein